MRDLLYKVAKPNHKEAVKEAISYSKTLSSDLKKKFLAAVRKASDYSYDLAKRGASKIAYLADKEVTDWVDNNVWKPLYKDVKTVVSSAVGGGLGWLARRLWNGGQ